MPATDHPYGARSLGTGVAVVSSDDIIARANVAFARLVGKSGVDLRGHEIRLDQRRPGYEPRRIQVADGPVVTLGCTLWRLDDRSLDAPIVIVHDAHRVGDDLGSTTLARVAEVMAHHFRNPIAGIGGAIKILRDRVHLEADRAIVDEMLARLAETTCYVDRLVHFVRPIAAELRWTSSRAIVSRAGAQLAEVGFRDLVVDCTGDDLRLLVDPPLLREAVYHLLLNAAEAMDGHGTASLETLRAGCWNVLRVSDTGGSAPESVHHMFEPFFTTKSRHLGLGLSLARRIAHAHNGELLCERGGHDGTTMTMRLPLRPTLPAARFVASRADASARRDR